MHPLCLLAVNDLVAKAPSLAWWIAVGAQLVAIGTSLAGAPPERPLPWQAHGEEAGGLCKTVHQMLQEPNRHALLSAGSAMFHLAG